MYFEEVVSSSHVILLSTVYWFGASMNRSLFQGMFYLRSYLSLSIFTGRLGLVLVSIRCILCYRLTRLAF